MTSISYYGIKYWITYRLIKCSFMKLINKERIEVLLEEKLKVLHKKFFLPIAYVFLGSIILGIVVRLTGPSVPLSDLPTLNYVVVKVCLWVICVFGPIGYLLAIVGLKRDWVEKPKWFKDNFNL